MIVGVSGATGFVGKRLIGELSGKGMTVVPLVRRPAGLPGEAVVGDLSAGQRIAELPKMDALVHLAARTHAGRETDANALAAYRRLNVEGTRRLTDAAIAAGAAHVVFLSSIKVNGEESGATGPFTEDDEPRPIDAYGITKLEAEQVVRSRCEAAGVDWTIVRPPLVYGAGVGANFARLVRLSTSGLPLPLGGIDNRRSLIHVANLVDFIALALVHPAARNRIFLVSDGDDVSTTELVRRIARLAGKDVRLFRMPRLLREMANRSGAVQRLFGTLQVDSREARQSLDWTPPMTLESGLQESLAGPE